jgi:membrane protein
MRFLIRLAAQLQQAFVVLSVWRSNLGVWARAVGSFLRDGGLDQAAAVAYYTFFSLFPAIILALLGLSVIFGAGTQGHDRLNDFIRNFFPVSAQFIDDVVEGIQSNRGASTGLSAVGLLLGATGMFGALNRAINRLWHLPSPGPFYRARMVEALLLAGFLAVFLLSILFTGFVHATFGRLSGDDPSRALLPLRVLGFTVPMAVSFGGLAVVYQVVPARPVPWRAALLGSGMATLLLEGTKNAFFWYVREIANFNAIYGPLSSVMLLLVWIYLSAVLVLFGASLTREYTEGPS